MEFLAVYALSCRTDTLLPSLLNIHTIIIMSFAMNLLKTSVIPAANVYMHQKNIAQKFYIVLKAQCHLSDVISCGRNNIRITGIT